MDETSSPRYLTGPEVADRLGVHVKTLRRLVARGLFPAPGRMGRQWVRWPEPVVVEYLSRLMRPPAPEGPADEPAPR